MEDIRWVQRFSSFRKALAQLEKGLAKEKTSGLNEFELQGVIKSFEFIKNNIYYIMQFEYFVPLTKK